MDNEIKSIAYASISKGVQIYLPDKDGYVIGSRLVCADCNEMWYTNLTECFLCGAINPFLYHCEDCGAYVSITNAGKKCNSCGEENSLHLECPNPKCLSNKNTKLKKVINAKGGVFDKESGFLISLQYCLKCGSQYHHYQVRKLFIKTIKDEEIYKSDLISSDNEKLDYFSFVIFRKQDKENIKYAVHKLDGINFDKNDKFTVKNFHEDFEKIIDEIFLKKYN